MENTGTSCSFKKSYIYIDTFSSDLFLGILCERSWTSVSVCGKWQIAPDTITHRVPTLTSQMSTILVRTVYLHNVVAVLHIVFFVVFCFLFSVRLLSVLRCHSVFSSSPQRPMTSDFEGFLYQILSITLFSYLNSWERASISLFNVEC